MVRQSERAAIYPKALQPLIHRGLVYGCACTRSEIQGSGSGIGMAGSGSWARLATPTPVADKGIPLDDDVGWRVIMEPGVERFVDEILGPQEQDPSEQCGDLLVRDRLGNWTYQFAVTVDDHLQRITDVIRGEDLLPSTGRQIGWPAAGPHDAAALWHHALVMKSPAAKAEQIRQ